MKNSNDMQGAGVSYAELMKKRDYPFNHRCLGENISLVEEVICGYWKPRYLLDHTTCTAIEFMGGDERLKTITHDDVEWGSLQGLPEKVINVARRLSFHYPSHIGKFENGLSLVRWQLNPEGRYHMDEDGYGMTDDDELNIYGVIDREGRVVHPFRALNNYKEAEALFRQAVLGRQGK